MYIPRISSQKQCMNRYFLQYKRDLDNSIFCHLEGFEEEVKEQFRVMVESLDIQKTDCTTFYCRDLLFSRLTFNMNNKQVKTLSLDYYG